MSARPPRPLKLLIAAMGGEGGGVLTDWIVAAARTEGLPVQSTSVPGVAQRTGATTYYVEIYPRPVAEGAPRPVLALMPSAGDLDLVAASELLEAGRTIANGFANPDRTLVIASTHRIFAMAEKTAMSDGRLDSGRLFRVVEENARRAILFDMEEAAGAAGSAINAVLLGTIAGSGTLPIAISAFEAAVRAEGKAVAANLAGFNAGLAQARGERGPGGLPGPVGAKRRSAKAPAGGPLIARAEAELAPPALDFAREGIHRLIGYQGPDYAKLYIDRLSRINGIERSLDGDGGLTREVARQLAVRMSYEDVIRVAQFKTDPARFPRIVREVGAKAGEPVIVRDYFKPGIEELCSLLPPRLARSILALAARRGWLKTAYLGMRVNSTSIFGFLRLRLLAALRPFRPRTYRFQIVQADLDAWLTRIAAAARLSLPLAREVAECARLVKGYGDTYARGSRNCELILRQVVDRAIGGGMSAAQAEDAVLNARTAALADPEGDALDRTLEAISARLALVAAVSGGGQ